MSLKSIVRREGEPVKSYLKRFDDEAQEINGLISDQAETFFCEGVRNPNIVTMLRVMAKGDYHKVVSLVAEFAEAFNAAEKEMQATELSKSREQRPTAAHEGPPQREGERAGSAKAEGNKSKPFSFPRYTRHAPLRVPVTDLVAGLRLGKLERAKNYNEQHRFGNQQCAVHGYGSHSSE